MKVHSTIKNPNRNELLFGEWIVVNGLGGYASGSLCGAPTRKYHGLLTAALPPPFGRTVMLNHVAESLVFEGNRQVPLSYLKRAQGQNLLEEAFPLVEFDLENGLPHWRYEVEGVILKKSLFMVYRQNTLHISYKLATPLDRPVYLKWRPFVNFRFNEHDVNAVDSLEFNFNAQDKLYEIVAGPFPALRFFSEDGLEFNYDMRLIEDVLYPIEAQRGYPSQGKLKSPGYFLVPLHHNHTFSFSISIEPWSNISALTVAEAEVIERIRRRNLLKAASHLNKSTPSQKLALAADQFIITPMTRSNDIIRLQAAGEDVKSIIAGFPWFTDWGRDTMISLEGLTLVTGRFKLADSILRTFAYYIKNGLIPNMFPDGQSQALYNTADATLWYFHAIDRYIHYTGDYDILEILLPRLRSIIDWHIKGTNYGIKVDDDGLLTQGHLGLQLTWMDAKVGDWVVTPRRGKAVEINALWYNALRLFEEWSHISFEVTNKCYESFNQRFWYEKGQYLYDVVDGENGVDDAALRPNQIFAISLKYPVLAESRWQAVIAAAYDHLLTPMGLRTLAPLHPDYKPTYDGDLRARDAAYHQGTVWPWLLGPFVDAWLKVYPQDKEKARSFLNGLIEHLDTSVCMGSVGEIFDAEPPYNARGCFSQAWSVAELLRCIAKTAY